MITPHNPTITTYLNQIKHYQQFTTQQEMQLIAQMHQGDTAARELLIKSYLALVVSIAHMHHRAGIDFEDLIQEGNIGLIEAIDRFDPSYGNKLNTYAVWRIRKNILRYIKQLQNPTLSLDTPICLEDEDCVFLADMIIDEDNLCGAQAFKSVEQTIIQAEQICRLYDKIDALPKRQREVVILLYGLGNQHEHSVGQTAKIMGINRQNVEKLREKALRRLS
jgi:RNA polymerase sigma factor (sigma-70 family)